MKIKKITADVRFITIFWRKNYLYVWEIFFVFEMSFMNSLIYAMSLYEMSQHRLIGYT